MQVLVIFTVISVALVLGAVVSGTVERRRFIREVGAFRCRTRLRGCAARAGSSRWRRTAWARWVNNVLLVRRGYLYSRLEVLPIRFPEGSVAPADLFDLNGLGPEPVYIVLRCDDETLVDVVVDDVDRSLLAGPFLAAAIPGLPVPPPERPARER